MSILETIRSMGFGAMLGSGLLGLSKCIYPELIHGDPETVLMIGALFGGGFHNLIDKWVINSFLFPIGKRIQHYTKLMELKLHRRMPKELRDEIYTKIVTDYFIEDKQDRKQKFLSLIGYNKKS